MIHSSSGRQTATWFVLTGIALLLVAGLLCQPVLGQTTDPAPAEPGQVKSLLDFIKAGGWVGHTIILLSVVGVALVVNGFRHIHENKLMPPALAGQIQELARQGRFAEVLSIAQAGDSTLSRLVRAALAQSHLGLPAMRQAMQDAGAREITRLQQQIGYIGFIASVAPMLGLLGTVTGMIKSFNVLGYSKGAARPDELARGIAEALVTTCEGLIVAIPLMFFYLLFRDRLTRLGQEMGSYGENLLRTVAAVLETRKAARPEAAREHTSVHG